MDRHVRYLTSALRYQTAGRFDQAEKIYRRILRDDSGNPDAHHLLGLVALKLGDAAAAARHIARAIQLLPSVPDYHCSLGNVLQQAGQHDKAILCYRAALERKPDYADAHIKLGNCLQKIGSHVAAISHYVSALEAAPDCAEAYNNLGNASLAIGHSEEGAAFLRHAVQLKPDFPEAWVNLASALAASGHNEQALVCCQQAVRLNPDLAPAQAKLGAVLFDLNRHQEAGAALERVLTVDPANPEACCNLAAVRLAEAQPAEAEELARRALAVRPQYPEALNTLGQALLNLSRLTESRLYLEQAIALKPGLPSAWRNLANLRVYMGDPEGADACYREALRLCPSEPHTNFHHSLALLSLGRLEEGWTKYEWRRRLNDTRWPPIDRPAWAGEDIRGKTILVRAEQGLGDTIQFLRYLPMLKRRGCRVVFECQPRLLPLVQDVPGFDELIGFDDTRPSFDVYAFLMSLPYLFETRLETIPGESPYIRPDPNLVRTWSERLGGSPGLRVGLSWAGDSTNLDDARRSFAFSEFEPLLRLPGISWVSLQRGEAAWQLTCTEWAGTVRQFENDSTTIADTAAIVQNLDLVLSADTMVAHLSGALGKMIWLLLCSAPDWRWLQGRSDSPWYPSMRIFRQTEPRNWGLVVNQVRDALFERLQMRTEDGAS